MQDERIKWGEDKGINQAGLPEERRMRRFEGVQEKLEANFRQISYDIGLRNDGSIEAILEQQEEGGIIMMVGFPSSGKTVACSAFTDKVGVEWLPWDNGLLEEGIDRAGETSGAPDTIPTLLKVGENLRIVISRWWLENAGMKVNLVHDRVFGAGKVRPYFYEGEIEMVTRTGRFTDIEVPLNLALIGVIIDSPDALMLSRIRDKLKFIYNEWAGGEIRENEALELANRGCRLFGLGMINSLIDLERYKGGATEWTMTEIAKAVDEHRKMVGLPEASQLMEGDQCEVLRKRCEEVSRYLNKEGPGDLSAQVVWHLGFALDMERYFERVEEEKKRSKREDRFQWAIVANNYRLPEFNEGQMEDVRGWLDIGYGYIRNLITRIVWKRTIIL